jgi:hypothetical protein
MTHIAGGSRRGVPKVWVLPVLALIAILVAISLGLLSRSVLIDVIAWWRSSLLLSSDCSSRATSSDGR